MSVSDNPKYSAIFAALALMFLASCENASDNPAQTAEPKPVLVEAAYAMPDRYAAEVVEQILNDGGNAVDAAVAAAFVLAVTFPEAGNIGGGGFMLTYMNGEHQFLDYREKAPLAANRDMYLDRNGEVIEKASLVGIRAVGVPGTVAGMWEAHRKLGSMSWQSLVAPAIEFAQQGFEVHPQTAAEIPGIIEWLGPQVNFEPHFGAMQQASVFKQPELAQTLQRIADNGRDEFYAGETARLLVEQMQRDDGLITQQDLDTYRAVWREPLSATWKDFQVVSAPPPSSGGFAVIQLLKMKEMLGPEFADTRHNGPQYVHLIAEMEKRVFADRAEYFGDPDFVDVPVQTLISESYIQSRAEEVSTDSISTLEQVQPGIDTPNTTHFSIVDKWGNAVSNTYTINWGYGSGVVAEGAGYILNNQMDDFSTKPGIANVYGVVGGTANEILPAKRMLSSMSPTILMRDNDVAMVLGTPGGSTIFTSVFQAIVNVIDHGMSTQDAVSASRFHHQLLPPDLITTSVGVPMPESTVDALSERGYRVEPHGWEFGDLQMIYRHTDAQGSIITSAASDARGIGVSGVISSAAQSSN